MSQDFAKAFYNSAAWLKCRAAYIASVFYCCELCHEPAGTSGIVHHKVLLTPANIGDPDVTLNWDRLEYLCQRCHNQTHGDSRPTREGVRFDEQGNLVRG